jgi:hypothetical protein
MPDSNDWAYRSLDKPEAPPPPPKTPPTRHHFDKDPGLGNHKPYRDPAAPSSPSVDTKIKVTPEQLRSWAKLFSDAADKLNLAGDYMNKINVKPGFFSEADMIKELVTTFNSTFVPNSRILSDSSAYVDRSLMLVANEFDNVENANLDKNTSLADMISSMTKLETGLKATQPVRPNTPTP